MRITIIGDNFMLAETFQSAIDALQQNPHELVLHNLPFPDQPVVQRSSDPEYALIKEYQGSSEQVCELCADADALITHLAPLTANSIARLPKLKFVGVARGGPVNVDRAAARAAGIRLVNAPGRNATAVAEFTVGALIAETRNIGKGHEALRRGEWLGQLYRADHQRNELSRMTVGIVGYSHIGKLVAKLLRAFNSEVIFSDPYVDETVDDRNNGIRKVDQAELLRLADAITLHAPATKETQHLINTETLAQMKRGSVLINTARGSLVDEQAVAEALHSGHLSGAVLETFEREPLPVDSPLVTAPNVILTPHIAGASRTTIEVAANMMAAELTRFIGAEAAINPCQ